MPTQQTTIAEAKEARVQRERMQQSAMEPPVVSPVAKVFATEAQEKLGMLSLDDAAGCESALETLHFFKQACSFLEFNELLAYVGEIEKVLKRHVVAGPLKAEVIATLYDAFDAFALELEALVAEPEDMPLSVRYQAS